MSNKHLKLFILQPFATEEETIEWLEVITSSGEFLILPNHTPLLSTVSDGLSIKYKVAGGAIKHQTTTNCILRVEQLGNIYLLC